MWIRASESGFPLASVWFRTDSPRLVPLSQKYRSPEALIEYVAVYQPVLDALRLAVVQRFATFALGFVARMSYAGSYGEILPVTRPEMRST